MLKPVPHAVRFAQRFYPGFMKRPSAARARSSRPLSTGWTGWLPTSGLSLPQLSSSRTTCGPAGALRPSGRGDLPDVAVARTDGAVHANAVARAGTGVITHRYPDAPHSRGAGVRGSPTTTGRSRSWTPRSASSGPHSGRAGVTRTRSSSWSPRTTASSLGEHDQLKHGGKHDVRGPAAHTDGGEARRDRPPPWYGRTSRCNSSTSSRPCCGRRTFPVPSGVQGEALPRATHEIVRRGAHQPRVRHALRRGIRPRHPCPLRPTREADRDLQWRAHAIRPRPRSPEAQNVIAQEPERAREMERRLEAMMSSMVAEAAPPSGSN